MTAFLPTRPLYCDQDVAIQHLVNKAEYYLGVKTDPTFMSVADSALPVRVLHVLEQFRQQVKDLQNEVSSRRAAIADSTELQENWTNTTVILERVGASETAIFLAKNRCWNYTCEGVAIITKLKKANYPSQLNHLIYCFREAVSPYAFNPALAQKLASNQQ